MSCYSTTSTGSNRSHHKLTRSWNNRDTPSPLRKIQSGAPWEASTKLLLKNWPRTGTPLYLPNELETLIHSKVCRWMCIAFQTPRSRQDVQLEHRMRWTSPAEYYWVVRSLKYLLISEISQLENAPYCVIIAMWHARKGKAKGQWKCQC